MNNLYTQIHKMPQRRFFAVGNGLFVMELTGGPTCVYDCGSTSQPEIDAAIDRALLYYPGTIDNLFISHYDKDHVNGLMKLLNSYKVRRIILPMMPALVRVVSSSSTTNSFLYDFILDPEAFIRNISPETDVIFVESADGDRVDNVEQQVQAGIDLSSVKSGRVLQGNYHVCVLDGWMYVIYNRRVMKDTEITDFLRQLGLPPSATTNDIITVLQRKGTGLKAALKQVFSPEEINKINDYSMVVWSGAANRSLGCLYTGDYNAQTYYQDLHNKFGWLKPATEVIQIPHHGSSRSFDRQMCSPQAAHVISARQGPYSRQIVDPTHTMLALQTNGFTLFDTRTTDIII